MDTKNQGPLRPQIYQKMDEKKTDELLEIWRTGRREGWTGAAFDVVEEILRKRLGRIPLQKPAYTSRANPPKKQWLIITVGIGVVLVVAAAVFNAPPTEWAATFTPSPTPTATATTAPSPTTAPTEPPAATPEPTLALDTIRPLTGVIKPNQNGGGYGELTVENGTTGDGVVILTLTDNPVMAAYIRSGDSFTMQGIRDGTYYLYFSTGSGWNGKEFTTTPSYQKFEDAFEFTTRSTTYTTWSVTLQGVVGGTAATEDIDGSEFPDIGE